MECIYPLQNKIMKLNETELKPYPLTWLTEFFKWNSLSSSFAHYQFWGYQDKNLKPYTGGNG